MVEQIAGSKALPDEVVDQIDHRADGVPLFVEELTKTVLESGLLREERARYVLDRPGLTWINVVRVRCYIDIASATRSVLLWPMPDERRRK